LLFVNVKKALVMICKATPSANKNLFSKKISVTIITLLLCLAAFSQYTDYNFKSKDKQISVSFMHKDEGVTMMVMLTRASRFEYIVIKRSTEPKGDFKPCHYITLGSEVNDALTIVERDKSAIPAGEDAFYQVEGILRDGSIKASPVIRLPGMGRASIE